MPETADKTRDEQSSAVATDLVYRWDGVHVWRPGSNLIFETIAPKLLALGDR